MFQARSPEEADRLLTQIARTNPDVLWMFAPDWSELRFVDEAYEEVWGRPIEALVEDPTDFLNGIHPDDRDDVREAMETLAEGTSIELEVRVVDPETTGIREVWIEGEPVRDDDEIVALAGYVRDITERKQRERELEELMQFLSHDLQNQIQLAEGYLDLAQTEGRDDHLETVARALDRMTAMTEDVLSLPQATPEEIDRGTVSLVTLARESWRAVPQTDADLRIDEDTTLCIDDGLFKNVLENLFRNAVRHNEVDVEIRVGPLDDGLYVEDDGEGIPLGDREEVFEVGFTTGGSGLGLPLVREIVTAHGGTITVAETDTGGARFEITGISLEDASVAE